MARLRVAQWVGLARVRPAVLGACAAVLLVSGAFAATLAPLLDQGSTALRPSQELSSAEDALDTDGDGLPDAVENRVGSDALRYDTLGGGVADGWLHQWYGGAVDWNSTAFLSMPALAPPAGVLPDAFGPEGVDAPTLQELFLLENATRGGEPAWWRTGPALDPNQWDNTGDGIADAWLVLYGLDPFSTAPSTPAPGDDRMTVAQKYEAALDPTALDTDGDGLDDMAERIGFAVLQGSEREFEPTDPRALSTRGDGIADGYLVRFGLDPHEQGIADRDPAGDGLDVRTAYEVSITHCRSAEPGCDISRLVAEGLVVDPTAWDTLGDGIADAWAVADPTGVAHPLEDGRVPVVFDTAAWDGQAWSGIPSDLWGIVEDDLNPPPQQPHEAKLPDLYAYQRPLEWDEARDGPWWNGIPTDLVSPEGALPPAVALRGWNITVDTCRGCNETRPSEAEHMAQARAFADPRSADTDGDGLDDLEEYFGVRQDAAFGRTDPGNPDTDGDGLADLAEITDWGTDPLRRDSSGSFLTDGEEVAYWNARYDEVVGLLQSDFGEAKQRFGWLVGPGGSSEDLDLDTAFRLHPLGSVLGGGPNVLSADSDGDGITDGAELLPNRFLDMPTSKGRPSTDPARVDTDGDGLPDPWEVRWSRDLYFECKNGCVPPPEANVSFQVSWPTDPSRWNSFSSADDVPGDGEMNLAGDEISITAAGASKSFSNGLAYKYDLHPFDEDSDGDGLSDMFEIHWGVEGIPQSAVDELEERVAADPDAFAWVRDQADRLGSRMPPEATDRPRFAVLDPTTSDEEVGPQDDLMGMFFGREKGTWIAVVPPLGQDPGPACTGLPNELPGVGGDLGHRHEEGSGEIPSRVGRQAPCWEWVAYPLASDAANGTDPWSHDFDGDGLPDAWEFHHNGTGGLDAAAFSDGSKAGGCQNPALSGGLPGEDDLPDIPGLGNRTGYCLTNLESYALGVDPGVGDTDGGGLADWLETGLGLDPLDPADDRGDEDWSGDGLPNRVKDELGLNRFSPDTDGDGLLDGDPVGIEQLPFLDFEQGDGNLCLRRGPDPMPNMEHRPAFLGGDDAGGDLTHNQTYDWFVSLGILHDTTPGNRCPDPVDVDGVSYPFVLFKREVMRDVWSQGEDEILGAGQGSDPLRWDSSGNGIPDGWLVHWRDHVSDSTCVVAPGDSARAALDPNDPTAAQESPDGTLPVIQNYLAGRPMDWDEARDGPWWGGMDPTCRDTDGDEAWYVSAFSGGDALDADWDGTGVDEAVDPTPGLGQHGSGRVSWNGTAGRYDTDYTGLWDFLEARAHAFTKSHFDGDGDDVPDFLDRARVQVDDVQVDGVSHLTKGVAQTFQVTGRLVVAEAPLQGKDYEGPDPPDAAGDGAGVAGATVKVVLSDGAAEAVLGFGVTGPEGQFTIDATSADVVTTGTAAADLSVGGTVFRAGEETSLPTGLSELRPGPVSLRVVAEPNDPTLQEVRFHDGGGPVDGAVAYKDVGGSAGDDDRFRIPQDHPDAQGPAMRAALVGEDGGGNPAPDTSADHVRHVADAVFAGTSSSTDLDLRALASLEVSPPASRVRVGEPLVPTGRLTDAQGVPLPDRTVNVSLLDSGGGLVSWDVATVGQDGTYDATFATEGLAPGGYTVQAQATLLPEDDFLEPPDPQALGVVLAQDTVWSGLVVNSRPVLPESVLEEPASAGLGLRVDLTDVVSGQAVARQDVEVRVTSVVDGKQRIHQLGETDDQGRFSLPQTDLPQNLPLSSLRVDIEAAPETGQDKAGHIWFFLDPVFETRVELEDIRVRVGETGFVHGTVLREGGIPVGSALGTVRVTGPGVDVQTNVTGADGHFMFPVHSPDPGILQHTVRFVSAGDSSDFQSFLASSPETIINSTHFAATRMEVDRADGIRDEPVHVRGSLSLADGRPVSGPVEVRWSGGHWQAAQASDGAWSIQIPARNTSGGHGLEARFQGTPALDPSETQAEVTIRTATTLILAGDLLRGGPDGIAGNLTATLVDQDGKHLAGRSLHGELTAPDRTVHPIQGVTDGGGVLRLTLSDIQTPLPGAWTWRMTYAGGQLEAPATGNGSFEVRLSRSIAIERLPAQASPGEDITVAGRVDAMPGDAGPTAILVRIDGKVAGTVQADPGEPWSMAVTVRFDIGSGTKWVIAVGDGGDYVRVEPDEAEMPITGGAHVGISEVVAPDGSRDVSLALQTSAGRQDGVQITLVRRGDDGRILGVHRVTTDNGGAAILHLDPRESGEVTVVHLGDPLLSLEGTTFESHSVPATPTSQRWSSALAVAAAGLVLAAGAAAAYLRWVVRNRRRIEDMFEEARLSLVDPHADPRTVVRRTYRELLRLLARAGYTPPEQRTVRDIADEVTRAFRLPASPMWAVSGLFERAIYSEEPMGEADRRTAVSAFHALSSRVHGGDA